MAIDPLGLDIASLPQYFYRVTDRSVRVLTASDPSISFDPNDKKGARKIVENHADGGGRTPTPLISMTDSMDEPDHEFEQAWMVWWMENENEICEAMEKVEDGREQPAQQRQTMGELERDTSEKEIVPQATHDPEFEQAWAVWWMENENEICGVMAKVADGSEQFLHHAQQMQAVRELEQETPEKEEVGDQCLEFERPLPWTKEMCEAMEKVTDTTNLFNAQCMQTARELDREVQKLRKMLEEEQCEHRGMQEGEQEQREQQEWEMEQHEEGVPNSAQGNHGHDDQGDERGSSSQGGCLVVREEREHGPAPERDIPTKMRRFSKMRSFLPFLRKSRVARLDIEIFACPGEDIEIVYENEAKDWNASWTSHHR